MSSRYNTKTIFANTTPQYITERRVNYISHFETPELLYPTEDELKNIDIIKHVWREGDRYWKLANEFYNRPDFWWVIAWFNKKPTEGHVKAGETISVPLPLSSILDYYGL